MIAKTLTLLAAIGVSLADKPFEGVDPNTLSCDPTGQEYLLLPHFSDCSMFFMCTHGNEVQFTCSGGLIFDFALQGCNWEWDAECVLRVDPDGDMVEGSGDDSVEWTEEGSGDEAEEKLAETPGRDQKSVAHVADQHTAYFGHTVLDCHNLEDATRQVVYTGDCQRYWRCVDGVPQTLYCSDGLYFNQKTQQCDFEANVLCNVEVENELAGEYMVYN